MGSMLGSIGGSFLGGAGDVVSAAMMGDAANSAAKNQSNAIDKIKKYTEENMDPAVVNAQALKADQDRAQARLDLQLKIDPALAAQRTTAQNMISGQLAGIGTSASDTLAAKTAEEALAGVKGMQEAKQRLITEAMNELNAGATLPADLQAELMQAGLQRSAQVTGDAGGANRSVSTSILQQVLGTAGVQLKAQRQANAANLITASQGLESQRQQILQGLFPKLQAQQMSNLNATSGVLQQSNAMLPQAGLSGADVSNVWLARVGAINQLSAQKAQVQAQGALATGAANASMWGSLVSAGQGSGGQKGVGAVTGTGGTSSGGGGGMSGFSSFFNSSPAATTQEGGPLSFGGGGGTMSNGMVVPSTT